MLRAVYAKGLRLLSTVSLLSLAMAGGVSAQFLTPDDFRSDTPPAGAVWLESLGVSEIMQEWGNPGAAKTVGDKPLTLKGIVYPHGIGTHARSDWNIDLRGSATRFAAMVGLDDSQTTEGSVAFEVYVDGRQVVKTGVFKPGSDPEMVSVDLNGAKRLKLVVTNGGDSINFDHANWAGAMLFVKPDAPMPRSAAMERMPAPKLPFGDGPEPAFHGPRITGATPGNPFLFLLPVTGEAPLTFEASGLPDGLTLDTKTGIVTGAIAREGHYSVLFTAKNRRGQSQRKVTIVGEKNALALTPPMGWNSWNVWGCAVDDAKVRAAADWMVKSGLAAHGFQYINIDDCWQAGRDQDGNILTNEKFPDMKALADYVHSKGLKLGIYSSPGPATCAGYTGSYQHEEQDARTYAAWGIDYLKHDWCSYGGVAKDSSLYELQKPYFIMRDALRQCGRDIVYSLCQYGMGEVWKWGALVDGNVWRTTGDITDTWASMKNIGFSQDGQEKYAGPGHWNDPDMLVVGKVGWGPSLHDSRLNPHEQMTHIALWSLLSSPLLIGCDLSQMDRFTLSLLTNDEVLDVNQDPLGRPAGRKSQKNGLEVWARPMYDGTVAVGLFNLNEEKTLVTASWSDLGLKGAKPVRDLWFHKDLGTFEGAFSAEVPPHGVVLVKIGAPRAGF